MPTPYADPLRCFCTIIHSCCNAYDEYDFQVRYSICSKATAVGKIIMTSSNLFSPSSQLAFAIVLVRAIVTETDLFEVDCTNKSDTKDKLEHRPAFSFHNDYVTFKRHAAKTGCLSWVA